MGGHVVRQSVHSGVTCAVGTRLFGKFPECNRRDVTYQETETGSFIPFTDYGHSLLQRRFFSFLFSKGIKKNTSSFMGSWTAYRHSSKVMLYSILLFISSRIQLNG